MFIRRAVRLSSLDALTQELCRLSESATPALGDQKALESALQILASSAKKCTEGSRVLPFGSAVTGFWTPHSDVDVCVQFPVQRSLSPRGENLGALKLLTSHLRRDSSTVSIYPVYSGKMPIVKWKSKHGEREVAIDLSVNNLLAVRNSELLRAYNNCNDQLRPLVLGLKLFAKSRGINDRAAGTLSSFSLVLMLLSYMQQRRPALLPDLQSMAKLKNLPSLRVEGRETRFISDESYSSAAFKAEIAEELNRINRGVAHQPVLSGQLLKEFLRYYAYEYKTGVIRVSGISDFSSQDTFLVENPFEAGRDVANVTNQGAEKVRREFKSAYRQISAGVSLVDVCKGAQRSFVSSYFSVGMQEF